IKKFNGTNFSFWKMQMEDHLYQKDLYLPWMVLDQKALGAIRLSLLKSIAFNIKGQETATDLMKALSNLYEQPFAARKVHL
ncbi:hypothetical protein CY35_06G103100, partial [Sphagnum magellanicum]